MMYFENNKFKKTTDEWLKIIEKESKGFIYFNEEWNIKEEDNG